MQLLKILNLLVLLFSIHEPNSKIDDALKMVFRTNNVRENNSLYTLLVPLSELRLHDGYRDQSDDEIRGVT